MGGPPRPRRIPHEWLRNTPDRSGVSSKRFPATSIQPSARPATSYVIRSISSQPSRRLVLSGPWYGRPTVWQTMSQAMPNSFGSSTSRIDFIGSSSSMRSGPTRYSKSGRSCRETRMLCCIPSCRMQTNPSSTLVFW